MSAAPIALLHLIRQGNDPAHFERFREAHLRHPPGIACELVLLLKGYAAAQPFDPGLHARLIMLPDDGQDLLAYRRAAEQLRAEVICCTNSFAQPAVTGWLGHLATALAQPGVGIAGASGSYKSARDATAQALASRPWWQRVPRQALVDLCFPAFPNPAIRTNAFVIRRADWLRLVPSWIVGKFTHAMVESGRIGVTRRLLREGRRALVVDRDGRCFDVGTWPASRTWRAGGQAGLLVRDNRSDAWAAAAATEQQRLAWLAWRDQANDFSSTDTTSSPDATTAWGRSGSP